jgi:hypothetical protein
MFYGTIMRTIATITRSFSTEGDLQEPDERIDDHPHAFLIENRLTVSCNFLKSNFEFILLCGSGTLKSGV